MPQFSDETGAAENLDLSFAKMHRGFDRLEEAAAICSVDGDSDPARRRE